MRLTDSTWKAWGMTAENFDLSRADLLENLVRQNQGKFPYPLQSPPSHPSKKLNPLEVSFNREQLEALAQQVLQEMRFKPNSPNDKTSQKALTRLIETLAKYYLEGGI